MSSPSFLPLSLNHNVTHYRFLSLSLSASSVLHWLIFWNSISFFFKSQMSFWFPSNYHCPASSVEWGWVVVAITTSCSMRLIRDFSWLVGGSFLQQTGGNKQFDPIINFWEIIVIYLWMFHLKIIALFSLLEVGSSYDFRDHKSFFFSFPFLVCQHHSKSFLLAVSFELV